MTACSTFSTVILTADIVLSCLRKYSDSVVMSVHTMYQKHFSEFRASLWRFFDDENLSSSTLISISVRLKPPERTLPSSRGPLRRVVEFE